MSRIDNSYLLGLWGLDAGTVYGGAPTTSAATKAQPTAPWSGAVVDKQPTQSEFLRKAMAGGRFVDENAYKLDVRGKTSSEYKTLFALHTGLQMLEAVALRSMDKGVGKTEAANLQKRFDAGLKELSAYLAKAGSQVDTVRLVNGESATKTQSSTVIPRDNHVYKTGALHKGQLSDSVEAFEGDVRFDVSIRTISGTQTIGIDLAEMGSTPRTMDAVIGHINGKLEAAGVETRFSRQEIKGEERTMTVGTRKITLPSAGDSWGMTITGSSTETVGFKAAQASASVQVFQGFGTVGETQALKFDPNSSSSPQTGQTNWVDGRIDQDKLPDGISTIRASAAGADGSTWIVADMKASAGGHSIRGESDVVLMKLDSAGRVVVSRGIGAASQASGFAISVSEDGRVAVAGSVTGGLVPGQTVSDKNTSDSFVTVFDAEGHEQWTQSRGAKAADEATGVAFGADGRVYVSGRSQSAMPGASSLGGWDSYVQTLGETQAHSLAPTIGSSLGVTQFGTSGDDTVQAMTVDGDNLYTAGVENGSFVVRQFRIGTGGAPELVSSRNLGAALSGEIANIAVSNGKLIVSGETRNASLAAGTVTRAHAGGTDAFVASISTDLSASGSDRVAYYGGEGNDSAADVKVVNGEVWMTGVWDRGLTAKATDPTTAYLARIDVESGTVDWSRTWTGDKEQAKPMALSVSTSGTSVLDRLGLPQGELVQDVSSKIVESTGLRAGDRFYIENPNTGRRTAVTIDARDTLQTLATKIETASGRHLKVTVSTNRDDAASSEGNSRVLAGGSQYLSITNAEGRKGAVLVAGEMGRDALAGLGLMSGYVGKTDDKRKAIGIDLPETLNLASSAGSVNAKDFIQSALRSVREAYRAMSPLMQNVGKTPTAQPSAYMQSQIANYQAALARLTS